MTAKTTVSPVALTGVAFAIAVMSDAAKAEGTAYKALEKRQGASWRALCEAAGAFESMDDAEKRKLSGELARAYVKYYPENTYKVVASQHARVIHLIVNGAKVEGFSGISEFLKAQAKPKTQQTPVGATGADEEGEPLLSEATKTPSVKASPMHGASVELGSAIARLVDMARKNPQIEDALLIAANHPDGFVSAMEALLTAKPASPAKVSQLVAKHQRAA